MKEVYENLCMSDPRNPNFEDMYGEDDVDVIPKPHRLSCMCDNCFYGRDKLAREILQLWFTN